MKPEEGVRICSQASENILDVLEKTHSRPYPKLVLSLAALAAHMESEDAAQTMAG
jgi:hypothetical protein